MLGDITPVEAWYSCLQTGVFELSDIAVGSCFSIDFDSRHRVLRVSPFGIITDEIMSNADAAVRRFLAQEKDWRPGMKVPPCRKCKERLFPNEPAHICNGFVPQYPEDVDWKAKEDARQERLDEARNEAREIQGICSDTFLGFASTYMEFESRLGIGEILIRH